MSTVNVEKDVSEVEGTIKPLSAVEEDDYCVVVEVKEGSAVTSPSTTSIGRAKGKGGRGKNPKLLRLHYGVMKLRQSRLTEHFKEHTVTAHPKKKASEWIEKCRLLRAQSRKFTVLDLLKLS